MSLIPSTAPAVINPSVESSKRQSLPPQSVQRISSVPHRQPPPLKHNADYNIPGLRAHPMRPAGPFDGPRLFDNPPVAHTHEFPSQFPCHNNRPRAAGKGKVDGKAKAKAKAKPLPPAVIPSVSDMDSFLAQAGGSLRKRKTRPEPVYDKPRTSPPRATGDHRDSHPDYFDASSDRINDDGVGPSSDDQFLSPKEKTRKEAIDMTPATKRLERMNVHSGTDEGDTSFEGLDMDVFMDVDDKDINGDMSLKPKPEDLSDKKVKEDDTPSWPSVYDSLSVMTDDTLGPLSTSTSTSRRNLFVLSRAQRIEEDEARNTYETDVVPEMKHVYEDFDCFHRKAGIKRRRAKFIKRKYVFGEKDVPKGEAQWMKVVHGFDEPQI
ncbi:hypothetical protein SCP_1501850 [Sparassis crispa]|uniref:Uncharacterized protein n=1 Tax=Sparassis crispa TaxID=139825 RepID=A0A401H417_9APHY|nr:hypothetical protein SCP_1501850 [Sparassis crispa]GBE89177.1 hypothetical protein SCP_1501850 [Sparassis crispa]